MTIFNSGKEDDVILASVGLLQDSICYAYEDVQGCKNGIATWWGPMAKKIFVGKEAQRVCREMSPPFLQSTV